MINNIVTAINNSLTLLTWVDKLGGVVHPLKRNIGSGEDIQEKTIPAAYNNSQTTCNTSKYIDYLPNTKHKSVLFWENKGATVVRQLTKSRQLNEVSLRLVIWLNLQRINKTYTTGEKPLKAVLSAIPRNYNTLSPYVWFQVNDLTVVKEPDIFAAYSIDEAEKQFLIYPFDYFAIDMAVQYVDFICPDVITIDASCLNA